MPNITLIRDHLFAAIGRTYTDKEFDDLCFQFGVEVDDVMTETIEVKITFVVQIVQLSSQSQLYFFSSPVMEVKKSKWYMLLLSLPTVTIFCAWKASPEHFASSLV